MIPRADADSSALRIRDDSSIPAQDPDKEPPAILQGKRTQRGSLAPDSKMLNGRVTTWSKYNALLTEYLSLDENRNVPHDHPYGIGRQKEGNQQKMQALRKQFPCSFRSARNRRPESHAPRRSRLLRVSH
jgi:hypothetical protein